MKPHPPRMRTEGPVGEALGDVAGAEAAGGEELEDEFASTDAGAGADATGDVIFPSACKPAVCVGSRDMGGGTRGELVQTRVEARQSVNATRSEEDTVRCDNRSSNTHCERETQAVCVTMRSVSTSVCLVAAEKLRSFNRLLSRARARARAVRCGRLVRSSRLRPPPTCSLVGRGRPSSVRVKRPAATRTRGERSRMRREGTRTQEREHEGGGRETEKTLRHR